MKIILKNLGLILIVVFLQLTILGQNNLSIQKNEQIEFEIIIPKIYSKKTIQRRDVLNVEQIFFLSSDEIELYVTIEYYKNKKDAENSIDEKIATLDDCEQKGKVFDVENKAVGVRYICQTEKDSKSIENKIIFTYGKDLYEFSSKSLRHLEIFESNTCPRSSTITGRKCPNAYIIKTN